MSREIPRVAVVSTAKTLRGGEEQARLLLHGLRRRGHVCLALARHGGEFAQRIEGEGFDVATFPGLGRSPGALWKLRKAIRNFAPQVVHYNDAHSLVCGGIASVGLGVARIAARRVSFALRSPRSYEYLADRVVCVSHAAAAACRASGLPPQLLRVVHSGVNPARAQSGNRARGRQALGLADNQRLLLCVATLTDCKGHCYLIDALPEIVANYPDIRLALAGDGDLTAALQRQVALLGLQRHVLFLGYRHDIPDLIQACDLFILPSHIEGLGTSLVDAMLAQRPIVTTMAGGIPELVGARGVEPAVAWLVPPRSAATLSAAMLEALAAPQKCREYSQRALARAQQFFTHDAMVEATQRVYRETLADIAARSSLRHGKAA